ncbi:MAG: response regulator [Proteobacteria bacterium]|nr:response regulator [Pseudomonadota bacterium]
MPGQPRLLVVDDEQGIREMLLEYFGRQGFDLAEAADAAAARALVPGFRPDLVLLDLNMPGENGLSLARWLRETLPHTGIIMLTAASHTVDRVVGLEVGADDYVSKPFDLRELLARTRSVLRRMAGPRPGGVAEPAADRRIPMGRCTLELDAHRLVDAQGAEVALTSMEFDLLAAFAANPNRPMDRDKLLELAHHKRWEPFDRSIDIRIARLRRKIEPDPSKPQTLRTVRGAGYMFVPDKD